MNFNDIVGFLITLAAIFYMIIKRAQDRRKHLEQSDEDEPEQAGRLKDFLKSLEIDMEDSEDFRPPPMPKVSRPEPKPVLKPKIAYKQEPNSEEFKFKSDLDDFKMKTNIEDRKLKINIKNKFEGEYGEHLIRAEFRGEKIPALVGREKPSRIKMMIRSLPSKKDMILLNEVLNSPKGFKF